MSSLEMWLIAGRAVFLLFSFTLAAVAFTRWRRTAQAQANQLLANHDVMLQRLADLEARVDATNAHLAQLTEQLQRPQQPVAATPAAPAQPGYQIAIRLAKSGASRDELISGCGLSVPEAELIHRLHAPQSRSGARKQRATTLDGASNHTQVA
jgi:alkylation response protein AidB-like acyl-CoA dehydrogenase